MGALPLPARFRFGVATAGFQVEGGYNGRGQPANNWTWWEAEGRVEPSGVAVDFWNRYERHLDRPRSLGCDAFRLSIEWARCEPFEGAVDATAVEGYGRILDACHERGLQPLVVLHHFCHPAWLGVDFWLRPDSPERFRHWVEVAVDRFAGRTRHWVTLNEINVYAARSYLTGAFPPGRRLDVAATVRTLDHMLAAHVLAYDAIKARQPQAVVTTTSHPLPTYELDRLLLDVLLARSHGVSGHQLRPWLLERRARYHEAAPVPAGPWPWLLRRRSSSAIPLDQALPRAVAAVYESPSTRALDLVGLDHYEGVARDSLGLPAHGPPAGPLRVPELLRAGEVRPDPTRLTRSCLLHHEPGLDVCVAADGLGDQVRGRRPHARPGGMTRAGHLKENLAAVVAALDAGVPVRGYFHDFAEGYAWGCHEPPFGLHGVGRDQEVTWSDADATGEGAAPAYGRILRGLRGGDRSVLT